MKATLSLITYTFIVYSISTVTLFFYFIIKGEPLVQCSASDWFWFIMLALIQNLLGHTLFNWSLKWVSTNFISIAILFESVGASVLAYYVFHETLSASQLAGGSIVIIGILLFEIDTRKLIRKFF